MFALQNVKKIVFVSYLLWEICAFLFDSLLLERTVVYWLTFENSSKKTIFDMKTPKY